MAAAHRAQADAVEIIALADQRFADEWDGGQERGEVATRQNNPGSGGHVPSGNMPPVTTAEVGISRKKIFEARQVRNAELLDPGIVRRTLDKRLATGLEPTKAALRGPTGGGAEAPESPAWSESKPEMREAKKRANPGLRRHDG